VQRNGGLAAKPIPAPGDSTHRSMTTAIRNDYPLVNPVLYRIEFRNRLDEWHEQAVTFDLKEARRFANRKTDRRIIKVTKKIVQ